LPKRFGDAALSTRQDFDEVAQFRVYFGSVVHRLARFSARMNFAKAFAQAMNGDLDRALRQIETRGGFGLCNDAASPTSQNFSAVN